jgi:hypothetical protein
MAESFLAVIMPLSSTGVPPLPGQGLPGAPVYPSTGFPPNLPGHALPGGPPVHPSQGPIYGGYPSHGFGPYPTPLPMPGEPGSAENPIKPVDPSAGLPMSPPIYIMVPGHGIAGPIYLPPPVAAPKA